MVKLAVNVLTGLETGYEVIGFFFQAEDGIRDWSVTGVQTCALPIYHPCASRSSRPCSPPSCRCPLSPRRCRPPRSEERRVGKEGRPGWSPYREKKEKKAAESAQKRHGRMPSGEEWRKERDACG